MEDHAIIDLYWARDEQALTETQQKYGAYCWAIAHNILKNKEDTEECVNDTYMRAWHAMPPHRPGALGAFLGKITRNLSLDRYKHTRAEKRGGGQVAAALDELGESVPGGTQPEQELAAAELSRVLDRFLRNLPEKECCMFLRRYWYVDSIQEISLRYGMAEGSVKSNLFRIRQRLKRYLEEEGIVL